MFSGGVPPRLLSLKAAPSSDLEEVILSVQGLVSLFALPRPCQDLSSCIVVAQSQATLSILDAQPSHVFAEGV